MGVMKETWPGREERDNYILMKEITKQKRSGPSGGDLWARPRLLAWLTVLPR
ncbi:uncharacterized protein MYCFIDRAFT_175184 [Pseudocercospora fijiensis CIRAD86]|uniref:Uncharacterized protein n=1 Tax=Pseudocercospora fijiensis (strain CIRAD86) TaxID=383855 RepID=M2ZRA9_PSEFD|nr:uncharacterized protein MYCFIDRAFT_175184 [Pseudocercospora fijiensis CIRAD86]EME81589.1 hypothetical protein MYCFIDRAFT_175184 [Pseudocercospora fijiensis CIRAD86]